MSKLEKRLIVFAIFFVLIYVGAVAVTIHSRVRLRQETVRLESAQAAPGEAHLMLAELFLPMMILLTVAVCFIVVKKKRVTTQAALDTSDERGGDLPDGAPDRRRDEPSC